MIKLAIDLGSSVTKIYKIGSGIVLAEASCVAVASGTNMVKAIGEEAKQLIGKTAEYTTIVFPVFEADIVNEQMAAVMLQYFLKKINIGKGQAKRTEVLFSVPCGAENGLLDKYYRLAEACGIGLVHFVEVPFLSAFGQNLTLNESSPVFVVDIGGGSTNIAAFSLDGIIAGIGTGIGVGASTSIARCLGRGDKVRADALVSQTVAISAVASIALTMLSFDLGAYTPLLIPLMILIAWLMVSNIPYPSFKHINWTTSMRFRSFVALIVCLILIVYLKEYSFAIIFLTYVFWSPIKYSPRAIKAIKYKYKKIRAGSK